MTGQNEAPIVVRPVDSFSEMDACVDLQQSVWQLPDFEVIPRRVFVVARAVGGQFFAAWDGETLAGYVLAVPGIRSGRMYLHSHMLAVAPEYRNRGIGMKLKLAQRDDALARHIDWIEWTFDPLQGKNAYFNLEKLGAIVRRYTPEFYGPSGSSANAPMDRLHAEWWLNSKRVQASIARMPTPKYSVKETVTVTDLSSSAPHSAGASTASTLELLLPVRRQFLAAFSSGLAGLGLERSGEGMARYLLGSLDEIEPEGASSAFAAAKENLR